jgi:hypothetical protein
MQRERSNDTAQVIDDPALRRLDFLMRYLGWHMGDPLERAVAGLNQNLGYTIAAESPIRRIACGATRSSPICAP